MTPSARNKTLLFFAVVVASSLSADAAEIQLKADVQARGTIVLLGDVAEIRDSDREQVAALRRLELFPAPSKNHSRVLRQREVRELLALNGVDVRSFVFGGAPATRIRAGDASKVVSRKPRANVDDTLSILVTRRDVNRGEVLRAADLELHVIKAVPSNLSPMLDRDAAVGLEVTRSVPAGHAIDARYVQRPILIRRGEPVTVFALATGVRVRTTARSLGQGSLGDLILLESLENRQRFSARITGVQRAEILASGVSVNDGGWPESGKERISRRSQKYDNEAL